MINYNGMMSPNHHIHRTWGAIVVGTITAGVAIYNGMENRDAADDLNTTAENAKKAEQAKLDKQKADYKSMKLTNPYTNLQGIENVYEDLTVNQKQANFQSQQGNQQRANIMQSMKGAAGSSGVAGLAQAMANQGQLQTQRISASIGMQESRNQVASAKGAAAVQASDKADEMAVRAGDQWVQQSEMDKRATLLGMQMGQATGSNLASQQTQANQMNAQIAQQDANTDMMEIAGQAAGEINWGGGGGE